MKKSSIIILFVVFTLAIISINDVIPQASSEAQINDANKGGKNATVLRFSSLGAWNITGKPPQPLQQMNGKTVKITGFMYPLEDGQNIKVFCLLRSTQTCCYGPKPQYNQYVLVEMNSPVKVEKNKPVIVTGKFFIDPKPEDGYIYRLEGTKVEPADEQKPEEKLSASDILANNLIFDFESLEALGPTNEQLAKMNSWKDYPDIKKFPEVLANAEGKLVTVEGYIVARTEDPQELIIGKYWWDGCCTGIPPTFYNAIVIFLKKGEKIPDEWAESGIFTGTLHTNSDKSKWPDKGIIRLENVKWGVSKLSR